MVKRLKQKPIIEKKAADYILSLVEIESALSFYFNFRSNIIVPNLSWGLSKMHECDLFIINTLGYVKEVEIKRSLKDFKKDFEKKHNHSDNRIKDFYYAFPLNVYNKSSETINSLLPENAGILVIDNDYKVRELKKSKSNPLARKLTNVEILKVAKLGCMRIWKLKEKLAKFETKKDI